MAYTKLFDEMIHSTIWRESDYSRILWVTMLALKNPKTHIVQASLPSLADTARITLAQCKEALELFQQPDEYSRSQEHEGRRIEKVEGGWFFLNGQKYSEKMTEDELRDYKAAKAKEYRDRDKRVAEIAATNENFIAFWESYPRKGDKKKAAIAFTNLTKVKQQLAIEDCKSRYIGVEKKFTPIPTTYINGERWDDDPINPPEKDEFSGAI